MFLVNIFKQGRSERSANGKEIRPERSQGHGDYVIFAKPGYLMPDGGWRSVGCYCIVRLTNTRSECVVLRFEGSTSSGPTRGSYLVKVRLSAYLPHYLQLP